MRFKGGSGSALFFCWSRSRWLVAPSFFFAGSFALFARRLPRPNPPINSRFDCLAIILSAFRMNTCEKPGGCFAVQLRTIQCAKTTKIGGALRVGRLNLGAFDLGRRLRS